MPSLPIDNNNNPIPLVPSKTALAVTRDTTVSASTEITLNAATTFIEVTALTDHLYMRWGTSDASNTAFDEFIVANTTRQYIVPTGISAVNFIDNGASGVLILIEK